MGRNGKQRAPRVVEVPAGPHVGGKPLSGLTALQKQAVEDLGISEVEWDTSTWQFREPEFSKLKQAERLAAVALGFDPTSWFLFAAIVRSKHARWLKDQKRAHENKTASPRGEAASAPKRVSHGASSSKAAASLRARAHEADVDAVAPEVEEVVADATAETRWLGSAEGLSRAGISLKNLHVRALKALFFWVIEGTKVG
jgi:hypothetical protein